MWVKAGASSREPTTNFNGDTWRFVGLNKGEQVCVVCPLGAVQSASYGAGPSTGVALTLSRVRGTAPRAWSRMCRACCGNDS